MNWISVDDRLPGETDNYLVVFCHYTNVMRYSSVDGWIWLDGKCVSSNDNDDITHWQPLPEPPKVTE